MKEVRFVKNYHSYVAGDVAGFEDAEAASLIAKLVAVDPKAKKAEPEAPQATAVEAKDVKDAKK